MDKLTEQPIKKKIRNFITLNSVTKDEIRQEYNEIFDKLKEYEDKQEWISVEERLPINDYEKHWKDRNYYLVYTEPSGLMYVAKFGYEEHGWWVDSRNNTLCAKHYSKVTHYMPLPTPPKMKGE